MNSFPLLAPLFFINYFFHVIPSLFISCFIYLYFIIADTFKLEDIRILKSTPFRYTLLYLTLRSSPFLGYINPGILSVMKGGYGALGSLNDW